MIVPIFIYRDRKSKEELREEAERNRRMRDAIREEEARERRRKALELWAKKCEEAEKRKKLEDEYYEEPLGLPVSPGGLVHYRSDLYSGHQ